MYTMHPDLAFLAIDDWVLYAGGNGTKTKLNPKKLAELEMLAGTDLDKQQ